MTEQTPLQKLDDAIALFMSEARDLPAIAVGFGLGLIATLAAVYIR